MAKGKRYNANREKVKEGSKYELAEALSLLDGMQKAKFDETVDLSVRLGVDPKHADQMVRGSVRLPNGTGLTVKILAFAKGDKQAEATEAGADHVGGEEFAKKIQEGWLDFDKVVATPDMMSAVGKLGSILGPRGMMPNPKTGTVTFDIGKAITDLKAGKVDFKVDKTGVVHTVVGKASFTSEQLKENVSTLLESIVKAKPSSSKGVYVRSITLSTSMGPGIRLNPAGFSI